RRRAGGRSCRRIWSGCGCRRATSGAPRDWTGRRSTISAVPTSTAGTRRSLARPEAGGRGLEVRELGKRYSDSVVVGPVSFTVAEGEFVSLLGPSGCGKTTTLRCIAGFQSPSAGALLSDDRPGL